MSGEPAPLFDPATTRAQALRQVVRTLAARYPIEAQIPSPVRERDRVRGQDCPERSHPSPQPSPARERESVAALSDSQRNEAADARFLLLHALDLTATDLALRGDAPIGQAGARALADALARRIAREPVARIAGVWEFWGLPFALSPETLVPRPDTETLVETALRLTPDVGRASRILDLGTGSGCILTALLHERPHARGIGTDRSEAALATARANAAGNGVGARALFVRADWCTPLTGPFDLIVSNPPYIASAVIPTLGPEVRLHDPLAALDGGEDGLDAYRAILGGVAGSALLAASGTLVLEVGHDQAGVVARLGAGLGYHGIAIARDLAGNERVVTLRPPLAANKNAENAGR